MQGRRWQRADFPRDGRATASTPDRNWTTLVPNGTISRGDEQSWRPGLLTARRVDRFAGARNHVKKRGQSR
jgi:hypothetical protein